MSLPASADPVRRGLASHLGALVRNEAFPGILLVVCAIVAMVAANLPWHAAWEALWHAEMKVGIGSAILAKPIHHWINDGLMVLFFFFVGLEIKHELLDGELASLKRAALPVAAAIGGMVVPAGLYAALNVGGPGAAGWGIPMATDIAFALGVLALLGKRVPLGLKVFLAALAIVDDLGAVLVIALFYTDHVAWHLLGVGMALVAASYACNRLGVRSTWPYAVIGIALWLVFLESGVHATIAGVLLALTIPSRRKLAGDEFARRGRELVDVFERATESSHLTNATQAAAVSELSDRCAQVQAPLQRMAHALSPLNAHVIVPLFALANAGVMLSGSVSEVAGDHVAQGVALGLLVGKPVGIFLASWLVVAIGWGTLPTAVTWRHIHGVAWLGGIGFTMSLFINGLAFAGDPAHHAMAKLSILIASTLAGVVGYVLLRRLPAIA
jgi:NhaA family Na+:H+ antiporter